MRKVSENIEINTFGLNSVFVVWQAGVFLPSENKTAHKDAMAQSVFFIR